MQSFICDFRTLMLKLYMSYSKLNILKESIVSNLKKLEEKLTDHD